MALKEHIFKLICFIISIYVAYFYHVHSQYVTIWSDHMENGGDWITADHSNPGIQFGSTSSYCFNATCLLLDSFNSLAYVTRSTNIANYGSIMLQYHYAKGNIMWTGHYGCEIEYKYDDAAWEPYGRLFEASPDINRTFTLTPPSSTTVFTIKIQSTEKIDAEYETAQCYFDELTLFGVTLTSDAPTITPTPSPSAIPSSSPTMPPTSSPSMISTHDPTADPTNMPIENQIDITTISTPFTPYLKSTEAPTLSPFSPLSEGRIDDITSTQNEYGSNPTEENAKKMDTWLVYGVYILAAIIALCILCKLTHCVKKQIDKKHAMRRIEATVVQLSHHSDTNQRNKTDGVSSQETKIYNAEAEGTGIMDTNMTNMRHKDIDKHALDVQYWLQNVVQLPKYYDTLINNGYESLLIIKEISGASELSEIGIKKIDDQKKILREIEELKHIHANDPHYLNRVISREGQDREIMITQEGN